MLYYAARSQGEHSFVSPKDLDQPFAIDVKGGGKTKQRGRVLPSMPKGEIVGNIVIDGKGIGKEGASEIVTRQQ